MKVEPSRGRQTCQGGFRGVGTRLLPPFPPPAHSERPVRLNFKVNAASVRPRLNPRTFVLCTDRRGASKKYRELDSRDTVSFAVALVSRTMSPRLYERRVWWITKLPQPSSGRARCVSHPKLLLLSFSFFNSHRLILTQNRSLHRKDVRIKVPTCYTSTRVYNEMGNIKYNNKQ